MATPELVYLDQSTDPATEVEIVSVFVGVDGGHVPANEVRMGSGLSVQTFQNESATIVLDGTEATIKEDNTDTADLRFLDIDSTTITAQDPANRDAVDAVDAVAGSSTWTARNYIRPGFGEQGFGGNAVSVNNANSVIVWHGDDIGTDLNFWSGTAPTTGHVWTDNSSFRIGAFQETVGTGASATQWYAVEFLVVVNAVDAVDAVTEVVDAPFPLITGVPDDFFQDTDVTYTISINSNQARINEIEVNGVTTTSTSPTQDATPITVGGFTFNLTAFHDSPTRYESVTFTYDFNIDSVVPVTTNGLIQAALVNSSIEAFADEEFSEDAPRSEVVITSSGTTAYYNNVEVQDTTTVYSEFTQWENDGIDYEVGGRERTDGTTFHHAIRIFRLVETELSNVDPDISEDQDGELTLDNTVIQNLDADQVTGFDDQEISFTTLQPITQTKIRNVHPNLIDSDTFLLELTDGVVQDTTSTTLTGITDGDEIVFDSV